MVEDFSIATATAGVAARRSDGRSEMNMARCSHALSRYEAEEVLAAFRRGITSDVLIAHGGGRPEHLARSREGFALLEGLLSAVDGTYRVQVQDKRLLLFERLYDHVYAPRLEDRNEALATSEFRQYVVLNLHLLGLGAFDRHPRPTLEELVARCQRYCRDLDRSSGDALFTGFGGGADGSVHHLGALGRRLWEDADGPVPFPGQDDLARDLLTRSLETHVGFWKAGCDTLDVVCEGSEPMRAPAWTRGTEDEPRSSCRSEKVEAVSIQVADRERADVTLADVTLAGVIAETALVCAGVEWEPLHARNPEPAEDTDLVREAVGSHWVGDRQYDGKRIDQELAGPGATSACSGRRRKTTASSGRRSGDFTVSHGRRPSDAATQGLSA